MVWQQVYCRVLMYDTPKHVAFPVFNLSNAVFVMFAFHLGALISA